MILLSLLGVLKLEPLCLNHHWHEEYRRRGEHYPGRRLGKAEKKVHEKKVHEKKVKENLQKFTDCRNGNGVLFT